ncbi:hypothetical protein [Symbiopectobacterium sp. RP]|uniref:hypothetical protein n=1 Tax=Symbiopectobacterium sp. RP TaxID=3248553 RepID=UPI003D292439
MAKNTANCYQNNVAWIYFSDINWVGELTGWPTKDASRDSFPSDHGMMLMIYPAFILRYFPRRSFLISLVIVVVFIAKLLNFDYTIGFVE